jgi:hypothetical protein
LTWDYHVQDINLAIFIDILSDPARRSYLTEVLAHQNHIQNINTPVAIYIPIWLPGKVRRNRLITIYEHRRRGR